MCQVYSVTFVLFVLIALINTGLALQCWKCHSEFDITCRDYFNVTRIQQNRRNFDNFNYGNNNRPLQQQIRNDPHLERCDESFAASYNQKTVCLKRVYRGTGNSDIPNVQRECRLVSKSLKEGECPEELTADRSRTVDFCGTCDFDGCNTASGIKTNLMSAILPVILLFVLCKK